MKLTWTYISALVIAAAGFLGLIVCGIIIIINPIDLAILEKYGSFAGGFIGSLFSMAGFLLLFEAIIQQQRMFERQQFESKYFDLLKIHRDNTAELRKRLPIKGDKYEEGRRVFVLMRKEFGEILGIIRDEHQRQALALQDQQLVNLAYLIFFYGVSETLFTKGQNKTSLLRERLEHAHYPLPFVDAVIHSCCQCLDEENMYIRFNGNQARLGHYFRHLFQMIKFVDQSSIINDSDKDTYIKTLRAQLSAHEQLILFYSAISEIGKAWSSPVNYISKYQLIRNVPLEKGFNYQVNPKDYFTIEFQ